MTTTKLITISGGFHNVGEIAIRAKIDPRGGIALSKGQSRKIGNHMCGMSGCMCGPHHGWDVEGCDKGDLTEAMYFAQND